MLLARRYRRLVVWLGCFAVLLATLAPAISNVVFAARADSASQLLGWLDICRGDASASPAATPSLDTHSGQSKGSVTCDHCPFCVHGGLLSLPPVDFLILPAVTGSAFIPLLFLQSSHRLFVWRAAQPRAPPAFI